VVQKEELTRRSEEVEELRARLAALEGQRAADAQQEVSNVCCETGDHGAREDMIVALGVREADVEL
jgi:hypothetical protein